LIFEEIEFYHFEEKKKNYEKRKVETPEGDLLAQGIGKQKVVKKNSSLFSNFFFRLRRKEGVQSKQKILIVMKKIYFNTIL
jgi:hypothetical protein